MRVTAVWDYIRSDYAIPSQLYLHDMSVCMFVFSPFCLLSLQAPAPQEGGAKAEVFSNIPPLLPSLFLVSCFHLIKSWFDSSLWFFFLQRARSGPDYKVPHPRLADVRPLEMHWFSCCVTRQQSTFIWLFIQKRKTFFTTVEQCVFWIMLLRIQSVHLPSLVWKVTSKKFQLVTHVQLPHTGDIQLQKKRQEA